MLNTEEARQTVERARRLGLIRTPEDEALFTPEPVRKMKATPDNNSKATPDRDISHKRLYWSDEEIMSVANEFKRLFPNGDEPLPFRIKDAQKVLPPIRQKTIIGAATLKAVQCAIKGKPIPPRLMGRAATIAKRRGVEASVPDATPKPRGRRHMITRKIVDKALAHPAPSINELVTQRTPKTPRLQNPQVISAADVLASEIVSTSLEVIIKALHLAIEQLSAR